MSLPGVRRPFWRRRLVVPCLGLLALNLVAFAAFTLPRSLAERRLAARAQSLEAEVTRERATTAELSERAETLKNNSRDVERFYAEVLRDLETDLVPALEEVDRMARESGIRWSHKTHPVEPLKGSTVVHVPITMPVSGSYRQIVSFIDRVERSHRFLIVDKIGLRGKGPGGGEVDLDFTLSAYFRRGAKGVE